MKRLVLAFVIVSVAVSVSAASVPNVGRISGEIEGSLVVSDVEDFSIKPGGRYEVHVPIVNRTGHEVCVTKIETATSDGILIRQHKRQGEMQDGWMEGPCLSVGAKSAVYVTFSVAEDAPIGEYFINVEVEASTP